MQRASGIYVCNLSLDHSRLYVHNYDGNISSACSEAYGHPVRPYGANSTEAWTVRPYTAHFDLPLMALLYR